MTQQVLHRTAFRWSEVFLYAAIGLGPLGLAISSSAQSLPRRFPIETAQVTKAMAAASLPAEGVEVKLGAPVTAVVENAAIKVETVASVGPHSVRMRLACRDHAECLPFFAVATFPDAIDASKLMGVKSSALAGEQRSASVSHASALEPRMKDASVDDESRVRAGSHANLEFNEDKIHIRLEVICLQSGTPGEHVRVSSLDHKQIYVAQVVTPTLLKGDFER